MSPLADRRVSKPFSMPVSWPTGSVLRWPSAAQVLQEVGRWADHQRRGNPDLLGAGLFGSYGRGDAGVGRDLDLVLILEVCSEPVWEWLRRWKTGALPLACDPLVYSLREWRTLPQWNPSLAEVLSQETRWLWEVSEAMQASCRPDGSLLLAPEPADVIGVGGGWTALALGLAQAHQAQLAFLQQRQLRSGPPREARERGGQQQAGQAGSQQLRQGCGGGDGRQGGAVAVDLGARCQLRRRLASIT